MTVTLVTTDPNKPIPDVGSTGNVLTADIALLYQTSSPSTFINLDTLNVYIKFSDAESYRPVFLLGKIQDNFSGALRQSGSVNTTDKDYLKITFGHSAKFLYNSNVTVRVQGTETGFPFVFDDTSYSFKTTAFSNIFPNALTATSGVVPDNSPVDKTLSFRLNGSSVTNSTNPVLTDLTISWDAFSDFIIVGGVYNTASQFTAFVDTSNGPLVQITRIADNLAYEKEVTVSATFTDVTPLPLITQTFKFKTIKQPTTLQETANNALSDIQSSYTLIKDDGAVSEAIYFPTNVPITIAPNGELTDFNVNFNATNFSTVSNSPIKVYLSAGRQRLSTVNRVQEATPLTGTVNLTNGSAVVTGVLTDFINQLSFTTTGDPQFKDIRFGTDKTPYKVSSVSTPFSLLLDTPYLGATTVSPISAFKLSSTLIVNAKGVLFGNTNEPVSKYIITSQVVRGSKSIQSSSPGVSGMDNQTQSTTNAIFLAVQDWARSLAGFRHTFTPRSLIPTVVTLTGACTATNGSAAVVGVGTSFLTQLSALPASNIRFGTDPVVYTVLSITDDQHLTMTATYLAATATNVQGFKISSDWAATPAGEATAAFISDPLNDSIPVCAFSPSPANHGVGFFLTIPTGANGFVLSMKGRPNSIVPPPTSWVGWTLFYRAIPDPLTPFASVAAWSVIPIAIDDQSYTTAKFQYSPEQTIPLGPLQPGTFYQFELVRTSPALPLLELADVFLLADLQIDFS